MLYKLLVPLFMAFVATDGVAASTTPVRRGGTSPGSYCSTGGTTLSCCNSVIASLGSILPLEGVDCVPILSTGCNGITSCCQENQNGLVNVGCTDINV